jgi:hypothetical protein
MNGINQNNHSLSCDKIYNHFHYKFLQKYSKQTFYSRIQVAHIPIFNELLLSL